MQLKQILSEVMSMSSQDDVSESDNDHSPAYQDEAKELKVNVIPYCCPLKSMDGLNSFDTTYSRQKKNCLVDLQLLDRAENHL